MKTEFLMTGQIIEISIHYKSVFNTHKNTSWPNSPSKYSICLSIYHKTHSHGKRKQQKNIIQNFPKRKRDGVKHTRSKIANAHKMIVLKL
ncbi:UNVERIFIED_CONTAM: hypothetical protein NCL1_40424 [Trichonephila clavipes]